VLFISIPGASSELVLPPLKWVNSFNTSNYSKGVSLIVYLYITSGTYYFLKKIEEKHQAERMLLMQSAGNTQLWHETKGATVFNSPRKYEIIQSIGDLKKKGFIVCNNIPVREEGRPVFEYSFKDQPSKIDTFTGFIAMRVLRPLSSDTYIIMSMWEDEKSFNQWKNSPEFAASHDNSEIVKATESTSVFTGPSYISIFVAGDEDDESE